MSDTPTTIDNMQVLICTLDGKKLATEQDALDLIGEAMHYGVELVLVPVERLNDDFFQLKTGLAGQIVQKFVTYRLHLVILGDISLYLASSRSFTDFAYEANRGNHVWLMQNREELRERLHARSTT